jgi:hypothetical protein
LKSEQPLTFITPTRMNQKERCRWMWTDSQLDTGVDFPPIHFTTAAVFKNFHLFENDKPNYAIAELSAWFDERPVIKKLIQPFFLKTYPWSNLEGGSHDFGEWYYSALKVSIPLNRDLCRGVGTPTDPVTKRFDTVLHSSNFYSVANILTQGLKCGPWDVKSGKAGIFSFQPTGLMRAKSSSGYRLYSDLCHTGHFWSVTFDIRLEEYLSQKVGSIITGNQTRTPEEHTYIVGMWFHVVHISEHHKSEPAEMWVACEDWQGDYEMLTQSDPWPSV